MEMGKSCGEGGAHKINAWPVINRRNLGGQTTWWMGLNGQGERGVEKSGKYKEKRLWDHIPLSLVYLYLSYLFYLKEKGLANECKPLHDSGVSRLLSCSRDAARVHLAGLSRRAIYVHNARMRKFKLALRTLVFFTIMIVSPCLYRSTSMLLH